MQKIYVTEAFLPPQAEYKAYLDKVWDAHWLTNSGPLLHEFEARASKYLGVTNFQFVANGTLALQIALRALDITEGEIITTPFSYVATISAILWERCTPVFVDIDPDTLNIDPAKIEAAITPKTKAIMPVHVFGNPCDTEAIEAIARRHNLKVIYDAAHTFGVKYKNKPLLSYGDISICSFHATKLFHTIEGGCVVANDKSVNDKLDLIKRFGHNNDDHYMLGINTKASEMQAAMGLCNLKYIDGIIAKRKTVTELYTRLLGNSVRHQNISANATYNYAYYPVIFENEQQLLSVIKLLNKENIFPRRYFFPSLNKIPYLKTTQPYPISEDISKRILCLPLYDSLEHDVVRKICDIIHRVITAAA